MHKLSSVENLFLVWVLLGIKHVAFHALNGNLSLGNKLNKKLHSEI